MLDFYLQQEEAQRKARSAYLEQETARLASFRTNQRYEHFQELAGAFGINWFLGGMICPDVPLLALNRSCYQKITDIFGEMEEE